MDIVAVALVLGFFFLSGWLMFGLDRL
ncbi:hypothetical protein COMA2_70121 [Candidatus Nitrospira nitrificans]|uniref:Uncharacterized protein n=1 Tax=Candidatus Nitrospira nitrificans TaxID=1742973 RepID=A0A0S4LP93_9BACT|nr:hypothetical protein COMA2_70121 [Candidatus Nitrospira nitrificans]